VLAVIVVNYKNEQKSIEFVQQEVSKITLPHVTVIVDNESTDASVAAFKQGLSAKLIVDGDVVPCIDGDCYVVPSLANIGFAQGNNLGASLFKNHPGVSHLVFSNNDIRFISENTIESLIEKIDTLPNAGMIGPNVIGLNGERQSPFHFVSFWDHFFWVYWLTPFMSKRAKAKKFDYTKLAEEGFHYRIMGSLMIMRSMDFFACGMMDPATFLYSEELILSERLKRIGKGVYFFPRVTVLHEHGQTTSKYLSRKRQQKCMYASECHYYRTFFGLSRIEEALGWISLRSYTLLMSVKNSMKRIRF